jgi:hypothetical protein
VTISIIVIVVICVVLVIVRIPVIVVNPLALLFMEFLVRHIYKLRLASIFLPQSADSDEHNFWARQSVVIKNHRTEENIQGSTCELEVSIVSPISQVIASPRHAVHSNSSDLVLNKTLHSIKWLFPQDLPHIASHRCFLRTPPISISTGNSLSPIIKIEITTKQCRGGLSIIPLNPATLK